VRGTSLRRPCKNPNIIRWTQNLTNQELIKSMLIGSWLIQLKISPNAQSFKKSPAHLDLSFKLIEIQENNMRSIEKSECYFINPENCIRYLYADQSM